MDKFNSIIMWAKRILSTFTEKRLSNSIMGSAVYGKKEVNGHLGSQSIFGLKVYK